MTHQASFGPDWMSLTMKVQRPARARLATTLSGAWAEVEREKTFPLGSTTVSSKVEPGNPTTHCRSPLPSAVTGKEVDVSPVLEVPFAKATGVPVTASMVRLKTVKESCRSAAGIAAGAVGAEAGLTVTRCPLPAVNGEPIAPLARTTPAQTSIQMTGFPPASRST